MQAEKERAPHFNGEYLDMYLLMTGKPLPAEHRTAAGAGYICSLIKTARRGGSAKYLPLIRAAFETEGICFEIVRFWSCAQIPL